MPTKTRIRSPRMLRALAAIACTLTSPAFAQPDEIVLTGDVVWPAGSTQVFDDHVRITDSLTIGPGVRVRFEGAFELRIDPGATLDINGEASNFVRIEHFAGANLAPWGGLRLGAGSNAEIDWALFGEAAGTVIALEDATLILRDSALQGSPFGALRSGDIRGIHAIGVCTLHVIRSSINEIRPDRAPDGSPGDNGGPKPQTPTTAGAPGAPGDIGNPGEPGTPGYDAIGIDIEAGELLVVSTSIDSIVASSGARGGNGGNGGPGGDGALGLTVGGRGGDGAPGQPGGPGGNAGSAYGIRSAAESTTIVNTVFNFIVAGSRGFGGRGGDGGDGGGGGSGIGIGFTSDGGRGGNAGDAGAPGPSGQGGTAASVTLIGDAINRNAIIAHTTHTFVQGTRGAPELEFNIPPGTPGQGGQGGFNPFGPNGSPGAPGSPGTPAPPAAATADGATLALHIDGAAAHVESANNIYSFLSNSPGRTVFDINNADPATTLHSVNDLIHNTQLGSPTTAVGTLDTNPLFDFNFAPFLAEDSPAIDSGDTASVPADIADLDNDGDTTEPLPLDVFDNVRIQGLSVDRGAFEASPPPCPADLNADGFLNATDINAFVSAFLANDSLADFNADGNFNTTDINAFVATFLAGCD